MAHHICLAFWVGMPVVSSSGSPVPAGYCAVTFHKAGSSRTYNLNNLGHEVCRAHTHSGHIPLFHDFETFLEEEKPSLNFASMTPVFIYDLHAQSHL